MCRFSCLCILLGSRVCRPIHVPTQTLEEIKVAFCNYQANRHYVWPGVWSGDFESWKRIMYRMRMVLQRPDMVKTFPLNFTHCAHTDPWYEGGEAISNHQIDYPWGRGGEDEFVHDTKCPSDNRCHWITYSSIQIPKTTNIINFALRLLFGFFMYIFTQYKNHIAQNTTIANS